MAKTLSQAEWNLARQTAFANMIAESKHGSHNLDVEMTPQHKSHGGKIVCKTCNKWVAWIPKAVLETL